MRGFAEQKDARMRPAFAALFVCLGLCLASKEAVRFTALWDFAVKDAAVLALILASCALLLAAVVAGVRTGRLSLRACACAAVVLALLQSAGLLVHTLQCAGAVFPCWVDGLAWIGKDSALVSLALFSGLLVLCSREQAIGGVGVSVALAGAIQIVLCFIQPDVARVLVCLLPLGALGAWLCAVRVMLGRDAGRPIDWRLPYGAAVLQMDEKPAALPAASGNVGFVKSLVYLLLVSTLLMCAYANWRPAQDGAWASLLIQLTSGAGLLLGGMAMHMSRVLLRGAGAFQTSRDVVFPIALAAVYLSTLLAGPGISLSVLLFDIAYALILGIVWLQPFYMHDGRPALIWICAGFAAYKIGWYVGVLVSTTLGIPVLAVALNASCLVVLIVFMLVQLGFRARDAHHVQETSVCERDVFAHAVEQVAQAHGLTARETDVFALLARGRTSAHIQQVLSISDGTARTHISHIYKKLGVNSQQALLDVVDAALMSDPG